MNSQTLRSIFWMMPLVVVVVAHNLLTAQSKQPESRVVQLSDTVKEYQEVLTGPPQTASMKSGYVVLAPAKSVGKHSTKSYEEAVVVLDGEGEMTITGGPTLKLRARSVAYCPPETEHDVVNTGLKPLRYVYIVSKRAR